MLKQDLTLKRNRNSIISACITFRPMKIVKQQTLLYKHISWNQLKCPSIIVIDFHLKKNHVLSLFLEPSVMSRCYILTSTKHELFLLKNNLCANVKNKTFLIRNNMYFFSSSLYPELPTEKKYLKKCVKWTLVVRIARKMTCECLYILV